MKLLDFFIPRLCMIVILIIYNTVKQIIFNLFDSCMGKRNNKQLKKKVAVIGGGIAGHGCCFTLSMCPEKFEPVLFETRNDYGGNAKSFTWPDNVITGLSVLAWPPSYFRNYKALLKKLQCNVASVKLPFMLRNSNGEVYFANDDGENASCLRGRKYWENDIKKWQRMVHFIRKTNIFFHGTDEHSMYHMSYFNPMNFITLRSLMRLFFISNEFWDQIIVPLYASSFLTIELNTVPAIIVQVLDDLIPLLDKPRMESWATHSQDVFDKMTDSSKISNDPKKNIDSANYKKGVWGFKRYNDHKVVEIYRNPETKKYIIVTAHGKVKEEFDSIVFASNSRNAASTIKRQNYTLQSLILNGFQYTSETDNSFEVGYIHSDPSIFPAAHRKDLLNEFANYIEVKKENLNQNKAFKYINTFIISSWWPALNDTIVDTTSTTNKRNRNEMNTFDSFPRLVTYGLSEEESIKKIKNIVGTVENKWNHPHMSFSSLLLSMSMRFIQGMDDIYYCGSYATPANGHDLSLCSGICIAMALGAEYPFPDDTEAYHDFLRLRRIMGI